MTPNEIIQNLLKFRWMHVGYGFLKCTSCGAEASIKYETKVITHNEPCSISCPWEMAQKYLDENKWPK